SSSSVLRAAVAGAPLTTILGVYNRSFFDLVARPEIRTLSDLRGKAVDISRYGASTEYAVRFGLKANNSPFEGKPVNFDKFVDFSIAREVVP
ncbi:MAG: ABC transporter substrate-binding protein, partial [Deltaproteobacteria bacterium]|nr:ABC transporter substrate-binding protein [Deltaproteobacteria bacterium]